MNYGQYHTIKIYNKKQKKQKTLKGNAMYGNKQFATDTRSTIVVKERNSKNPIGKGYHPTKNDTRKYRNKHP